MTKWLPLNSTAATWQNTAGQQPPELHKPAASPTPAERDGSMAQPEGQHGKHSTLLPEPPIATEGPTQRTGGIPNATAMPPARTGLACSLVPVRGPEERAAGPQAEDGVTRGDPKDQGGSSHTAQHVPHSDPNAPCPGGLAARSPLHLGAGAQTIRGSPGGGDFAEALRSWQQRSLPGRQRAG